MTDSPETPATKDQTAGKTSTATPAPGEQIHAKPQARTSKPSAVRLLLLLFVVIAASWALWVNHQILYYANHNFARPADAIAVFGAAEYNGVPSPALVARLNQALALYQQGLAPLMITLGGSQNGDLYTEGGVGRDYLIAHGVPADAIIAETESRDTEQSVLRLAAIARENNLKTLDVVSDGSHLFRVHALCAAQGLTVFTSPRPMPQPAPLGYLIRRRFHEMASYTAWRLHLH